MNFELVGKLIEKSNEVQVNDRFKKREFVLEVLENSFVEQIKFQLTQDKTGIIEPFGIGDQLKVSFNIKGNKWKDTYFVNLQAWRIENASASSSSNEPPSYDAPPPGLDDFSAPDDGTDLPF